jgi:hydrogenase small subunit
MTPFYKRLPAVAGFGVERTADTIGAALAVGAAAGVAAHAVATSIHRARHRKLPVAGQGQALPAEPGSGAAPPSGKEE